MNKEMCNEETEKFLIISGHDYRSKRQANIHFITRELAKRGQACFFSVGFSRLSKIKKDPRLSLWDKANKIIHYNGVDCYLWRTFFHPVNLRRLKLSFLEGLLFNLYISTAPKVLCEWVREATTIVIESGMGIAFFDFVKKTNPKARIIYRCSDALETIGCAGFLQKELQRQASRFDIISLPSKTLVSEFPQDSNFFFVPHGMDTEAMSVEAKTPYPEGIHAVSVGSMLFDPKFFEIAAEAFPDITFHVIGGGEKAVLLRAPNLRVYGEMPFKETLAYLQHAHIGIAPYQGDRIAPYLVDTSMKLKQFGYLGLPAVCPRAVVGDHKGRFGYTPEDSGSIVCAIKDALLFGRFNGDRTLMWAEVASRVLHPEHFQDTRIEEPSRH